jgi:hypothetical protein
MKHIVFLLAFLTAGFSPLKADEISFGKFFELAKGSWAISGQQKVIDYTEDGRTIETHVTFNDYSMEFSNRASGVWSLGFGYCTENVCADGGRVWKFQDQNLFACGFDVMCADPITLDVVDSSSTVLDFKEDYAKNQVSETRFEIFKGEMIMTEKIWTNGKLSTVKITPFHR